MAGILKLLTQSGGSLTITPTDTASAYSINLPSSNDTITTNTATQILTNKTLTTPVINGFTGDTSVVNIGSGQFYKDTSGNIGIGTSSPNCRFEVKGGSAISTLTNSYTNAGLLHQYSSSILLAIGSDGTIPVLQGVNATNNTAKDVTIQPLGGNLGLGVTPGTWSLSGAAAIQNKNSGWMGHLNNSYFTTNATNTSGNWTYISNAVANLYAMESGSHKWYYAGANTGTISFTQAMTLDASGRLGIGTTSPDSALHITSSSLSNQATSIGIRAGMFGGGYAAVEMVSSSGLSGWIDFHDTAGDDYIERIRGGAGQLEFYTNKSASARAIIDSSGRLTVPNQPAFYAIPPANYTLNGGDQTISGTWSEITDRSNSFNNGTFTAPVSGFYYFTWSSFVTSTSTRNDCYILVNGAMKARSEISGYAAGTTNRSSMVSVGVYLSANDNVTVGVYINGAGNTYVSQSPWGNFSGFLVG